MQTLANRLTLGGVLDEVRRLAGGYEFLDHWQQGEFHHDTVIRVDEGRVGVPGQAAICGYGAPTACKSTRSPGPVVPPGRFTLGLAAEPTARARLEEKSGGW